MMPKFAFASNTAITNNPIPAMMAAVRGAMFYDSEVFLLDFISISYLLSYLKNGPTQVYLGAN
jgi:hypothetical protein